MQNTHLLDHAARGGGRVALFKAAFFSILMGVLLSSASAQISYLPSGPTAGSLQMPGYNSTAGGRTLLMAYNDGIGASTNSWSPAVTIPFPFSFYGTPVTQLVASKNGLVSFDATLANTAVNTALNVNTALPNADLPNLTIAGAWGDFKTLASGDNVYYSTFGTAPNREFWINYFSYTMDGYSFLYAGVVLEESTNNIHFVDWYLSGTGSLTLGAQNNATEAVQFSGSPNFNYTSSNSAATDDRYFTLTPYNKIATDLALSQILAPVSTLCYSDNETVSVRIMNNGTSAIDFTSNPATVGMIVTGTNAQTLSTTVNTGTLAAGATRDVVISSAYDMSATGTYNFKGYTSITGDTNTFNDSSNVRSLTAFATVATFPYIQNFEGFTSAANATGYTDGWTTTPANTTAAFRWNIDEGGTPTGAATGPSVDHTMGTSTGKYIFTEASSGATGAMAILTSPCFNISSLATPALEFWYHMRGSNMGNMYVEILDANGTTIVDSIIGQQHVAGSTPWSSRQIDLSPFSGIINVRFRGVRGNGINGDMAIDDVRIFNPSPVDVSPIALVSPMTGVCYGTNETVSVRVENKGTQPLDFGTNNMTINVIVGGPMAQNVSTTISSGTLAVGADQVFVVGSGVDMSVASVYTFNVNTYIAADGDMSNDTMSTATRTVIAPLALPLVQDFNAGTTIPSGWTNNGFSISSAHGNSGTNGLYRNIWSTATSYSSIRLPKVGPLTSSTILEFDYRYVDYAGFSTGNITAYSLGAGDSVAVYVSTDCGVSFTQIGSVTQANHTAANTFSNMMFDLSAYAGDNVIVRVDALWGGSGDYFLDMDNFSIRNFPAVDATPTALVSPISLQCFGASETVSVRVLNNGSQPLDFSVNPMTINVAVSGAVSQTLSTTINTGTLAVGADQVFVVDNAFDMSSAGTYTFMVSTVIANDGFTANDNMAALTRTVVAPLPMNFTQNFNGSTSIPSGWTNSGFAVSGTHGKNGTNGLYRNIYSTGTSYSSIMMPKVGPANAATTLAMDYRYVNYTGFPNVATTLGAGDSVSISVSTDCGVTFNRIGAINQSNHTASTDFARNSYDLSAFAGDDVIVKVEAFWGGSGDYYLDMDNFFIGINPNLMAFNLLFPQDGFILDVDGSSLNTTDILWNSTNSTAGTDVYTFILDTVGGDFTSPFMTMLSNNSGADTMLTLSYFNLDQFLVSVGAQVGDTVNTDWMVKVNNGSFSEYATDTFNLVLVRGNVAIANCPIQSQPTLTATDACGTGNGATLMATPGFSGNYVVYLDQDDNVIGSGPSVTTPTVTGPTVYKAADANVTGAQQHVGPLANVFPTGFGNFTNGMFFTAINDVRIDSVLLKSNGALTGVIRVWDTLATLPTAKILQEVPFTIGSAGEFHVPVGLTVTPGNYFMNFAVTSGTGLLFRAQGGTSYPYTIPGLISLTGGNGNASFVYYFFDWVVTEACIGTPVTTTVDVQYASTVSIPFFEGFENGQLPCNWTTDQAAGTPGWLYGTTASLSSGGFTIPAHGNFMATNDDDCDCDKSVDYLMTPMFDFTAVDSVVNNLILSFESYLVTGTTYRSFGTVDISTDGGATFTEDIYTIQPGTAWLANTLNLNNYAGMDSVVLRFHHDDDGTWGYGLAIDDVSVDVQSKVVCNVSTQPNVTAADVCVGTNATITSTPGAVNNSVVFINANGKVIGYDNMMITSLSAPVTLTAADSYVAGPQLSVGPSTTISADPFPASNFSNGLYFKVQRSFQLDSVVLKHSGTLAGFINVWDTSVNAIGVTAVRQQSVPFSVTGNGETTVPVGMLFTEGNYFMNFSATSGTGILHRTLSGASFPYTIPGMVTITGTDLPTAPTRYYYFFDWTVTEACIGTPVSFTIDTLSEQTVSIANGDTVTIDVTQSATLDAGNASVVWSTGDSTQTIMVDGAVLGLGTFTYYVENQGNCAGMDSVVVVVTPVQSVRNMLELGGTLSVYPNPSSGVFNIELEGMTGLLDVRVFDLQGKEVYNSEYFTNGAPLNEQIDISRYAKGVYMLKLSNGKALSVKRLIVQ